jgi:hypothetical protein
MHWRTMIAACVLMFASGGLSNGVAAPAEWTIMVFLNAKNNLEADGLVNFREMAATGSSSDVNVLVEMGRPKTHVTTDAEGWDGVLRFRITKGQQPVPEQALVDLRGNPALSDMGSPAALQDFVEWSIAKFPAKRYMLVIWNHGQGWRFQMAEDEGVRMASARAQNDRASVQLLAEAAVTTPQVGGYRAASFDDDTHHFLYNSDIQHITEFASSKIGRKLDLIGFDACLMSMIETAYAFRRSALLLVSSEELEPGAGWDYVPIIRSLVSQPKVGGLALAKAVVAAYKGRYGDYHNTTMSITDLGKVDAIAASVSHLGDALAALTVNQRSLIQSVRSKSASFGADGGIRTSIDLPTLTSNLSRNVADLNTAHAARDLQNAVKQAILLQYASSVAAQKTGATGMAIYFPSTMSDFNADPYHMGYLKDNTDHPLDFVRNTHWPDFLTSYLR